MLSAFAATHYTPAHRSAFILEAMRTFVGLLVLVAVCGPAVADSPPTAEAKRPRVALVLSGGGARGLAHVGVLQVLEEMKVPVDCVVGTSMGALVGGTYAAGVGPGKMREALGKTDILSLFDDPPQRSEIPQKLKREDYKPLFEFTLGYNNGHVQLPLGTAAGYKFELFLKQLVGAGASLAGIDFDKLPTPYRAVATDLENGHMRVFDSGDLPKVMRASMSLPAIVAPTVIDGSLYVDGGLVRNLPVDIGRQVCGEVIIAVSLGTPLVKRDKLRSVLDIASQSLHLMAEQNVQRSLARTDRRRHPHRARTRRRQFLRFRRPGQDHRTRRRGGPAPGPGPFAPGRDAGGLRAVGRATQGARDPPGRGHQNQGCGHGRIQRLRGGA